MKNLTSEPKIPVVAFLSDFGIKDWYAAVMKAVVAGSGKIFQSIDITHLIEPGNISQASFVLANCHSHFPKGTIFVAVVDPGVGTQRKPLCIKADGFYFIGPDNGVFTGSLEGKKKVESREIKIKKVLQSHTFHGRDVFAPAARDLLRGMGFSKIGPSLKSIKKINLAAAVISKNEAAGEIIHIDHFGSAITNFKKLSFRDVDISKAVCRNKVYPHSKTFGEVSPGARLCFWGSSGYLELSVNLGSASKLGSLKVGDKVRVKFNSKKI